MSINRNSGNTYDGGAILAWSLVECFVFLSTHIHSRRWGHRMCMIFKTLSYYKTSHVLYVFAFSFVGRNLRYFYPNSLPPKFEMTRKVWILSFRLLADSDVYGHVSLSCWVSRFSWKIIESVHIRRFIRRCYTHVMTTVDCSVAFIRERIYKGRDTCCRSDDSPDTIFEYK